MDARLVLVIFQRLSVYIANSIAQDTRRLKITQKYLCLPVAKLYLWLERRHSRYTANPTLHPAHAGTERDKVELGSLLVGVLVVRGYILSLAYTGYLLYMASRQEAERDREMLRYDEMRVRRELREMQMRCQEKADVICQLSHKANHLVEKVKKDIEKLREEEEKERGANAFQRFVKGIFSKRD